MKYTNIVMEDKPFKVRTFYFGCEDKSKPTLVLTHGFMGNILSFFQFLKMISKHYRLIAFDNASWGLNTRTEWKEGVLTVEPDVAERWILDFWERTIAGLDDCPEKFLLAAHSHGGY